MQIRALEPSDAERYREIRLNALRGSPEAFLTTYEMEREKPLEETRQQLQSSEGRFVLGVWADRELAGIVAFVRESHPKLRHKGNVYAMYVAPHWRGRGIGKALIAELVRRAQAIDGLEKLNLSVVSDNAAAKSLYESAGFRTYGTEPKAMKSQGGYLDEDLMTLEWQKK